MNERFYYTVSSSPREQSEPRTGHVAYQHLFSYCLPPFLVIYLLDKEDIK